MAEKVQANYEQLSQIASKFSEQSQVVAEVLQKVKASMQQLQDGGWIGKGADSFFSEMHSVLLPAVQRLEHVLGDASNATNKIAQMMQQAEEESQSLFSVR